MYTQLIADFIAREKLPDSYAEDALHYLVPLAQDIMAAVEAHQERPLFFGVNGAQGTGKSTLCALLETLLTSRSQVVARLSLDDFYLTRSARQQLAKQCHPLFASRGVPGTHDMDLLQRSLALLSQAGPGDKLALPRFDKAADDRAPEAQWPWITGPVDLILLEGWFVGAKPQSQAQLQTPVNALEATEDGDGRWRSQVNQYLAGSYQEVFAQLDQLLLLQAPSFEQVYEWRALQEDKLRQRRGADAPGVMDDQQVRRFIQHFERLTRHCLATLPGQADRILFIDSRHRLGDSPPADAGVHVP